MKPTFDEKNPTAFHRDSPDGVWSVCDELRYDMEMKAYDDWAAANPEEAAKFYVVINGEWIEVQRSFKS